MLWKMQLSDRRLLYVTQSEKGSSVKMILKLNSHGEQYKDLGESIVGRKIVSAKALWGITSISVRESFFLREKKCADKVGQQRESVLFIKNRTAKKPRVLK